MMALEFQVKGSHDLDARDRVGFQAGKKRRPQGAKGYVCENGKV